MARGFARLAAPRGRMDVDAAIDLDPPIHIEDPDGRIPDDERYVTRVLQRLVQRPALNGQVVRVDLNSWNGTTYRVRAGGEALRVLPGHLRELREMLPSACRTRGVLSHRRGWTMSEPAWSVGLRYCLLRTK